MGCVEFKLLVKESGKIGGEASKSWDFTVRF